MADNSDDITDEVFYLGGILGSGVLVREVSLHEMSTCLTCQFMCTRVYGGFINEIGSVCVSRMKLIFLSLLIICDIVSSLKGVFLFC